MHKKQQLILVEDNGHRGLRLNYLFKMAHTNSTDYQV